MISLAPATLALLGSSCACAGPAPCEGWGAPTRTGTISDGRIVEASGLAASRVHADLLWTHNDRGDEAVLYALGVDGRTRGTLGLGAVAATDWEDVALGVGPGGEAALYVGDVGDNTLVRPQVYVLRVAEPDDPDQDATTAAVDVLELSWPDGPVDAEALAVDPRTNRLVLATKEKGLSRVYEADALQSHGSRQVLALVGQIDLEADRFKGGRKITAMDFSPDGSRLLLRTQTAVLVYERSSDESLAELLQGAACLAPAPEDAAAESLASSATGFLTTSEGAGAPLWQVAFP